MIIIFEKLLCDSDSFTFIETCFIAKHLINLVYINICLEKYKYFGRYSVQCMSIRLFVDCTIQIFYTIMIYLQAWSINYEKIYIKIAPYNG